MCWESHIKARKKQTFQEKKLIVEAEEFSLLRNTSKNWELVYVCKVFPTDLESYFLIVPQGRISDR